MTLPRVGIQESGRWVRIGASTAGTGHGEVTARMDAGESAGESAGAGIAAVLERVAPPASDGTAGTRASGGPAAEPLPRDRARDTLRERWFACSNALGWSAGAQWGRAEVDGVCGAVVAGADAPEVERALGAWASARARAGIGLAETLTDLAALHTAVCGALGELVPHDGDHLPGADGSRLVRAVALAWTDVACGELADTAVVDPLSGLPTARYLQARLAEVYRSARARGARVGSEHALVVMTMDVGGWARIRPLSVAGEAAAVVFDAGESIAVLGRSTVVVLAPREGLAARTRVLRRLVERRLADPDGLAARPAVRTVALPATFDGACAVLDRLLA